MQKFGFPPPPPPRPADTLKSLLDGLNDKLERQAGLGTRTEIARERFMSRLPCGEIGGGEGASSLLHSGKSSPTPDTDQISSTPESISDAGFHSSLTPLYEDLKTPSQSARTDSSDVSLEVHAVSSGPVLHLKKSRQSIASSTSSNASPRLGTVLDSTCKTRPAPPMRTCSYMSAVMLPPTEANPDARAHAANPASVESVHFPSNSLPDTTPLEEQAPDKRTSASAKNMRPQSAPAARQFAVGSLGSSPGSSPFERYSSHVDPLALTPPKPHPAGPPASVAVLKSRNVPYYSATSHTIAGHDSTQQCVPVQCWETSQVK